ncbi:hypothetical protein [Streptomyces sp. SDr-06]|nr:hypothetical protein [Streptomyces sp. SDr-06]
MDAEETIDDEALIPHRRSRHSDAPAVTACDDPEEKATVVSGFIKTARPR